MRQESDSIFGRDVLVRLRRKLNPCAHQDLALHLTRGVLDEEEIGDRIHNPIIQPLSVCSDCWEVHECGACISGVC